MRALKLENAIKNLINQFITNTKQANDFGNYQDNSIFALLCRTYLLKWIGDHQNYLQYTAYWIMTKSDCYNQLIELNKSFKLFLFISIPLRLMTSSFFWLWGRNKNFTRKLNFSGSK